VLVATAISNAKPYFVTPKMVSRVRVPVTTPRIIIIAASGRFEPAEQAVYGGGTWTALTDR